MTKLIPTRPFLQVNSTKLTLGAAEGHRHPRVCPGCTSSPSGMKPQTHKGPLAAQPPAIAPYNPVPILLLFLPPASSHPRCPSSLRNSSRFLQLCSSPGSHAALTPVLGISRVKQVFSAEGIGPETSSLPLLKTTLTSFHFCYDQFELTSAELLSSQAHTALSEGG